MTYQTAAGLSLAIALLLGGVAAGQALKSGLQPGETLPGAFHPLNVTGEEAGKRHCLV
jgi:hypothetical protein